MARLLLRPTAKNANVRCQAAANTSPEPLLVRCARGESVERPAAWMMRQAGRYQKAYRDVALKHPSFRVRSETTDLIVEISLQPFNSFRPDGVILFSDILTPLDAFGVHFEIDDNKGPLIEDPIRSADQLSKLHEIDLGKLSFVGEALSTLRQEVGNAAALLGFVGSPWTLATYIVEGKSTSIYKTIKCMARSDPDMLHRLLDHLAEQIATYCQFQIDSGAQCLQLFDSWGGQLTPADWDKISKPYIEKIIQKLKKSHPETPIVLYVNGSGGLLERMASVGANVIGLDWTVDMADARKRIGKSAVQGNVDPCMLFSNQDSIKEAVHECILKAGPNGHILNLGHGVLVGTPEENVGHFFDINRAWSWENAPARV